MESVGVGFLASASGQLRWLAVAGTGQWSGCLPPGPPRHEDIVAEAIAASGVGSSWVAVLRHRHEPYVRPTFWSVGAAPESPDPDQQNACTLAGRSAVRAKNRLTPGDAHLGYESYEPTANVGDPGVVATAGSEAADAVGWAWINGAGVVGRGVGPAGSTDEAEVLAITQALMFYPARAAITVLSASVCAVETFAALASGNKINFRLPSWLFQRARQARKRNAVARIERALPRPELPGLGLVGDHARQACRRLGVVRLIERPESLRPAILRRH